MSAEGVGTADSSVDTLELLLVLFLVLFRLVLVPTRNRVQEMYSSKPLAFERVIPRRSSNSPTGDSLTGYSLTAGESVERTS